MCSVWRIPNLIEVQKDTLEVDDLELVKLATIVNAVSPQSAAAGRCHALFALTHSLWPEVLVVET